jgi:purine-nucleoside phosphorylase
LILGSGLGGLADEIQVVDALAYGEIPGIPKSTAPGHAGSLILGYLAGVPVVAMKGRAHLYEGHSPQQITFPVRCLAALGATTLVVSNASGGINGRYRSGDVVVIDQHIDWMWGRSGLTVQEAQAIAPTEVPGRRPHLYDPGLIEQAVRAARECGFDLPRGTYLATLGPNYETRAEYRCFRKLGADMVGMSTVPETLVAAGLGMRVLAFSIITNVARPDAPPADQVSKTTHEEVLDWALQAQRRLVPLVKKLLNQWSGPPD